MEQSSTNVSGSEKEALGRVERILRIQNAATQFEIIMRRSRDHEFGGDRKQQDEEREC